MSLLLLLGLGAIVTAIVVTVVVTVTRPAQEGVSRGLASIEDTYAAREASRAEAVRDRFESLPGWLRSVAERLSPSGIADRLQHQLDLAGNPAGWTPDRVLAAKGLGLFGLAGLGALYGLSFSAGWFIMCAALGGAFGFFLPDLLVYNAGIKRQEKIRCALPDALDMLTVCVEAGLGFDAALAQVARNTKGPLAAEFSRALREMQIGTSRNAALRGMTARTTVTELRAFVSALVQATELGISIATVLREQSRELRLRRRQRAEERAQKVPVKILFPLIVCIFPVIFVVIIGPGAITISETLFR
ncbi:type II secretion system F family protein [Haloechinothrix salitolerans]|uniref:Type II secretion system F family protein n=1 Tax=Haloechinothrix salitolerans TaxID=926830 RepID=A0ABW2C1V7_9PSEU